MTQIMTNGLLPNLDEKNKAEVDKLFDEGALMSPNTGFTCFTLN